MESLDLAKAAVSYHAEGRCGGCGMTIGEEDDW
jgi:hypothetical protein